MSLTWDGIDPGDLAEHILQLAVAFGHGSNTSAALDSVTGKILDTAIGFTPVSDPDALVERVTAGVNLDFARYDAPGGGVLTTNQGRRGGLPAGTQWLREGGVNYIMRGGNRRWSAARWGRYQAAAAAHDAQLQRSLAVRLKAAKASIGLTPQSWVQVADDLGITLRPGADKFRAAVARNGIAYKNASGTRGENEEGIFIDVENWMPSLGRNGGAEILQRAIDTRLSAFQTEIEKGVLDDLRTLSRRYPAMQIIEG